MRRVGYAEKDKHLFWIDLDGKVRRPMFVLEHERTNNKIRRFCSRCGRLDNCYERQNEVLCHVCTNRLNSRRKAAR